MVGFMVGFRVYGQPDALEGVDGHPDEDGQRLGDVRLGLGVGFRV